MMAARQCEDFYLTTSDMVDGQNGGGRPVVPPDLQQTITGANPPSLASDPRNVIAQIASITNQAANTNTVAQIEPSDSHGLR